MSQYLDQILISYEQPDFDTKLDELFVSKLHATWFSDSSKRDQVRDIVEDVSKRKIEALVEYTEKFDSVKLTPEQLKISAEDLQKAHSQIDKNLLASLNQAIENVRKYQQEIVVCESIP